MGIRNNPPLKGEEKLLLPTSKTYRLVFYNSDKRVQKIQKCLNKYHKIYLDQ